MAQQVVVTPSGARYHQLDCPTLKGRTTTLSLEEALKKGYTPCQICKPPHMEVDGFYQVNKENLRYSFQADTSKMVKATVDRVVDGDTVIVNIESPPIVLNSQERVRLIGVDTPETVHPTKQVELFGKEASTFAKRTLEDQTIFLAFDWDLRDKYGRVLAYIYLNNGLCYNALLIQNGYGFAYLNYPFQFMDEFSSYQKEAQRFSKGLWADSGDSSR